jgi:hypothetical protein
MARGVALPLRLSVLAALSVVALLLTGCGGRAKPAAAPTEPPDYDWAKFSGDAATSTPPRDNAAEKAAEKQPDKQPEKLETKDAPQVAASPATDTTRKASITKIGGLSVSEVSVDVVAASALRATRRGLVSTTVIVGTEYEQVSVVLQNLAVQIVRPAATPDKSGPKLRSPKARKEGAAKSEAAFYDPRADVLVLVQADKKGEASRALSALVSSGRASSATPAKKNVRAAKPKRA